MTCRDCIHFKACMNILRKSFPNFDPSNYKFTNTCELFEHRIYCVSCEFYDPHIADGLYTGCGDCCFRLPYRFTRRDNDFCSRAEPIKTRKAVSSYDCK